MNDLFILIILQIFGFALIFIILIRKINKSQNYNAIIDKVRIELNSIMVEINHTTEQNIRLIEEKINSLSNLLSNADKKINILKRETAKHEVSNKVYDKILLNKKENKNENRKEIKPDDTDKENNIQDRALKLFYEGFSKEIIAGKLGVTIGEIELMISLKDRR